MPITSLEDGGTGASLSDPGGNARFFGFPSGATAAELCRLSNGFWWDGGTVTVNTPGLIPEWVEVPASSTSPGVPGQLARDGSFLYVCHAPGQWQRFAPARGW